MDAVMLRGIERILIVMVAAFIVWLCYLLYKNGISEGTAKLENESLFMKLTLSGTGPGLFFMAFGAIILVTALFTGKAETGKSVRSSIDSGSEKTESQHQGTQEFSFQRREY